MQEYLARNKIGNFPPLGCLEAATGSGKSTLAYELVKNRSRFNPQIVVCHKIEHLNQWEQGLLDAGCPEKKIENLNHKRATKDLSVSAQTQQWINRYTGKKNCTAGIAGASGILLITQETFKHLSRLERPQRWDIDLYFDELPTLFQPHNTKVHNFPETVKDYVKLDRLVSHCKSEVPVIKDGKVQYYKNGRVKQKTIDDRVFTVIPNSVRELRDHLENHAQTYHQSERKFLYAVLSRVETVYVKNSQWEMIGKPLKKKYDSEDGETYFLSQLNSGFLSGWNSCTVISADFSLSMFHHRFSSIHKLKFLRNAVYKNSLRYGGNHKPNCLDRLQFIYVISDDEKRRNSKEYLKGHGTNVDNKLMRELRKMGNPNFLLATNNDRREDREITCLDNCTVISAKEHGSNKFQDKNVIVFDAALNNTPKQQSMLAALGYTDDLIYQDMTLNTVYQTVSRSSIRDDKSEAVVTVFLMDRSSAVETAKRFASGYPDQVVRIRHIDENEFACHLLEPSEVDSTSSTSTKDCGSGATTRRHRRKMRNIGSSGRNGYIPVTMPDCTNFLVFNSLYSTAGSVQIRMIADFQQFQQVSSGFTLTSFAGGRFAPFTCEADSTDKSGREATTPRSGECSSKGQGCYIPLAMRICTKFLVPNSFYSTGEMVQSRIVTSLQPFEPNSNIVTSFTGFAGGRSAPATCGIDSTCEGNFTGISSTHGVNGFSSGSAVEEREGVSCAVHSGKRDKPKLKTLPPVKFAKWVEREHKEFLHNEKDMTRISAGIEQGENVSADFVILDFYGSCLTPDDFVKIFNPTRKNKQKGIIKHSFVVCSNYSPSGSFRVYLFMKARIASEKQYHAVLNYVVSVLAKNGYPDSGLDPRSGDPMRVCTLYTGGVVGIFNLKKSRELERYGLDASILSCE
ncbi:hypothetical protein [Microbulbifer taiwanensis]|nr:hypothetical protein [Microbulbifer taiwanensis]